MGTRAVSGTWVFLVRLLGSWSEHCALDLVGCGSWGSHAHPLASCFFSLALLVSLVVFSLVVISLVVLCLQMHT